MSVSPSRIGQKIRGELDLPLHEVRERLPKQTCALGYTLHEIETILSQNYWNPRIRSSNEAAEHRRFEGWMHGQTMGICEGRTQFYHACKEPHGTVIYRHDLERYLAGLRPLDW